MESKRALDEKEDDMASEVSSTASWMQDSDRRSTRKRDDHVRREERQRSEDTSYYEPEEDDDSLMLNVQRAPRFGEVRWIRCCNEIDILQYQLLHA